MQDQGQTVCIINCSEAKSIMLEMKTMTIRLNFAPILAHRIRRFFLAYSFAGLATNQKGGFYLAPSGLSLQLNDISGKHIRATAGEQLVDGYPTTGENRKKCVFPIIQAQPPQPLQLTQPMYIFARPLPDWRVSVRRETLRVMPRGNSPISGREDQTRPGALIGVVKR